MLSVYYAHMERARNQRQGAKWIRRERRLALYIRDGLACVYCGDGIEDGATLTLDHCKPNAQGGCNGNANLVTACKRCNERRGTRPVAEFARAVADYCDVHVAAIERHVRNCRRRAVDVQQAKDIIARRGGWAPALVAAREETA